MNDDLISRSTLLDDIRKTIEESGCVNHEGEMLDCIRYAPVVDAVVLPCKPGEYWRDWNGDRVRIETVSLLQNRGLYDIGTVTYSYEDEEDDFACN